MKTLSLTTKYGYLWATLAFFLLSVFGHWMFAWFAYVDEQQAHAVPVEVKGYVIETLRDTFENWQSEFLQLMWQVGGLALLLYIGSLNPKKGRREKKKNLIICSEPLIRKTPSR